MVEAPTRLNFVAAAALAVAVVGSPAMAAPRLPAAVRIGVAVALVVVGCVLVSFAVAFHADNLVDVDETDHPLEFPCPDPATWTDYLYSPSPS